MFAFRSLLWSCIHFILINGNSTDDDNVINIKKNGPIEYCNINPMQWDFEPLTSYDLARITKLKQVHVLARHGTRILPTPITDTFPNSTSKFVCDWTTVNTRYYKTNKEWMSFRLHFVDNEQIVEGNCAVSSSLKPVINQHRTNADMAKSFYIGEQEWQLMTQSQLNDIAGQLSYYNQLHQDIDIPEIKIISANYERTITSATVFMSKFLNIDTPDIAMKLYTHDYQSDPYTSNKDKECTNFNNYINDIGMESIKYKQLIQSDLMKKVEQEWYQTTGTEYSYDRGESAVLMYCGGLDVPLTFNHFLESLNMSYYIREAILNNNETSIVSCKLAASPMIWLFKQLIHNHILYLHQVASYKAKGEDSDEIKQHYDNVHSKTNNEYYLNAEKAQLIYHSVHDTSILYLLEAFGISNGKEPMFAEMLTLEIYERSLSDPYYDKNIEQTTNELYANYLFRWTRKGKPLAPFPGCQDEYDYTKSSLCSLSILINAMNYGVNIKPWEPICKSVVDQYYKKKESKNNKQNILIDADNNNNNNNESLISYMWTLLFGISIGIGIMMFYRKYDKWFNQWKYESIQ